MLLNTQEINEEIKEEIKKYLEGLPGGSVVKNPSANARDTGLIPSPGRPHIPRRNETHTPQLLKLPSLHAAVLRMR